MDRGPATARSRFPVHVVTARWRHLPSEPEEDAVRRALVEPGRRGVRIVGGPGVGKTTLAASVLSGIGRPVVRVDPAASTRGLAFGGLAGTIRVPERAAVEERLDAAIQELSARVRGAILVVDHAEHLDALSAIVVRRASAVASRVVIVSAELESPIGVGWGTGIDDGRGAGTGAGAAVEARSHLEGESDLAVELARLASDGGLETLRLAAWDVDRVARVLVACLGGGVARRTGLVVHRATAGVAREVRELVERAVDDGRLALSDGRWRWTGPIPVSGTYADEVGRRFDALSVDARDAVLAIAACGPLSREEAERTGVVRAIAAAVAAGFVAVDAQEGRASLVDPRMPDIVTVRADAWRMRALVGAFVRGGRELEVPDAGEEVRLAVLSLRGDEELPPARLAAASGEALRLGRVGHAIELARAFAARVPGPMPQMLLAQALSWRGEAAEAEWRYASIDPTVLPADAARTLRVARAANLFWGLCDAERAQAHLERSDGAPPEALERGLAAAFAAFTGDLRRARALAGTLDGETRADAETRFGVLWANVALSMVALFEGDRELDERARVRGFEAAEDVLSGDQRFAFFHNAVSLSLALGHVDDAVETARHARAQALGETAGPGIVDLIEARIALARGELSAARGLAEDACDRLASDGPRAWQFVAEAVAARACAEVSDPASAELHLAAAQERFGAHVGAYAPLLSLAEAWCEFARGREARAEAALRRAAAWARSAGARAWEFEALLTGVRMRLHVDASRLRRFAEELAGPLPRLVATATGCAVVGALGGPGDRRPGRSGTNGPGDRLAGAIEAARLGMPLLAAELRFDALERRAGRGGHRDGALAFREEVVGLGLLDAATIRARLEAPQLTRREHEISKLVADGLTNPQIARELCLSVRTVETHIANIRAKLGLPSRRDIAGLWGREGA